ncbi:MAG: branched-chain amino acid ABC transporter permease [Desulfobacteraceae bacterium]|nr:branched-chain amino acid ABC transporter permease [Desulfobacteraceae bacterium]MDH3874555.1 branched-chain amino acid ABC transporter permease [Desulfobacteraceae bacterium]
MKPWQMSFSIIILTALLLSSAVFSKGYVGIFVFSLIINGTMAVSYDIPGRSLGLISLGHAVFFGLGAYCFGISISKGLSFFPAVILSVILSFVGALLVTLLMAGLKHGYYSLATLGILIIFQKLFETLESITGGSAGLYIPETISKLHCNLLAAFLLLATAACHVLFSRSRWGLYSKETEASEEAAEAIGIPTRTVKILCLMTAAIPACMAGVLHLARNSHVSPVSGFSLTLSITALLASRVVPLRGILGPLIGALLITAAEEVIWTKFEGFNQAWFGLILLGAALYQGINFKRRKTISAAAENPLSR